MLGPQYILGTKNSELYMKLPGTKPAFIMSSSEEEIHVQSILLLASLFRKKRFALNEMFQRNASKFAIFYV